MTKEIFTNEDIISSYTDQEAVSDGTIHILAQSNNRVTNSALMAIKRKYNYSYGQTLDFINNELLPISQYAFKIFNQGGILKTNFRFKVGNFRHSEILWFIPNENNGLTVMRPEDY